MNTVRYIVLVVNFGGIKINKANYKFFSGRQILIWKVGGHQ